MEQYINKKCKVLVNINGKLLNYKAIITSVSSTHIDFTDKFNKAYSFNRNNIIEISEA